MTKKFQAKANYTVEVFHWLVNNSKKCHIFISILHFRVDSCTRKNKNRYVCSPVKSLGVQRGSDNI